MDIIICINDASCMTVGSPRWCNLIHILLSLKSMNNNIRIGFVIFRSSGHHWVENFDNIQNMAQFENWYSGIPPIGGDTENYGALGFGLAATLGMQWRQDDAVKKLVILLTDRVPDCLRADLNGYDLWDVSNRLCHQQITLIPVGLDSNAMKCEDFFWALAIRTGGIFLSYVNARRILPEIITNAMTEHRLCAKYYCMSIRDIMSDTEEPVAGYGNQGIHGLPNASSYTLFDRNDISERAANIIKCANINDVRSYYNSMQKFFQ